MPDRQELKRRARGGGAVRPSKRGLAGVTVGDRKPEGRPFLKKA